MRAKTSKARGLSPSERRRTISEWATERGWVNVANLAEAFGVTQDTIRNDLDVLAEEGLVTRTHGGAAAKTSPRFPPPYSTIRNSRIPEKSGIAHAALAYLPESGAVFIAPGSTTYQLATCIPAGKLAQTYTNSLPVAEYLVTNSISPVYFPGGAITAWALASDWSLSEDALEGLYWEVLFMGASAVDVERGISEVDMEMARRTRSLIKHTHKTVLLCDSSKMGKVAHAIIGPLSLVDVLITDPDVESGTVDAMAAEGVEVVVAEPKTMGIPGDELK